VGLELVWGFAVTLALGGWLCCLGIAVRPVLATLVGLGLCGLLLSRRRPRSPDGAAWSPLLVALAVFCGGLLVLTYGIGLFDGLYQPDDDLTTYFLHARQIVETGTLQEPFSFRRMASYGGQSFLHALLLVFAPITRLNLVDRGVARVAVGIALLAAALDGRRRSLAAALVVGYVVGAHEDMAFNTSSVFTGALAFVGLWLTLETCRQRPERPVANGVLSGLAIAATLPLRLTYVLPCGLIVLFEHASRFRGARDPRQLKELGVAAACTALAVGGWALLQLQATGTPLYPLLRGFANPEWDGFAMARSLSDLAGATGKFLAAPQLQLWAGLCCLALLLPRRSRDEASLRALAGGALLALGAHFALLALVSPGDMLRYTLGFMLPPALIASMRAAAVLGQPPRASDFRERGPWIAAAIVLTLLWCLPPTAQLLVRWQKLQAERWEIEREPDWGLAAHQITQLQNAAPAGAKLLVMLETPFLLDLRRNDVAALDLPGGVSPPPGLDRIQSPAGVAAYLVDHGYGWLAAVRPERSGGLYSAKRWNLHASGVRMSWHATESDVIPYQVMGRTIVRFFRTLDVITRSCRLTYSDEDHLMIDLSHCEFGRSPRSPR
jgi:hypothetical protein